MQSVRNGSPRRAGREANYGLEASPHPRRPAMPAPPADVGSCVGYSPCRRIPPLPAPAAPAAEVGVSP